MTARSCGEVAVMWNSNIPTLWRLVVNMLLAYYDAAPSSLARILERQKVDFRIVQSEFMFYCFGAQKHPVKCPRLLLVGGGGGGCRWGRARQASHGLHGLHGYLEHVNHLGT
ncbi:hypothetical protein MGG_17156 [Pyricularia oryzae 70-15]|uniref:Uncharacterized protein n=1 Tax=Pyricularia oryzae (strain 70-15 / ATCC MYA-4617 / FGSC 8958) TaxID=242507 RepID=G4N698_PYRO7|nr:uncharacterized protein MGG_17156 [Pyricularia oryzae 70-15]EHA50620.1 hypothetical protein MGG_17156 [Pyricularia oryzae 70-15]